MAVVQISKIQVRRGQKNAGTGLPQLASGELGWAIDTRELYIGNGSVSEGAPQVGNTKVLTEFDDIFALADSYTYNADNTYTITGTDSSNAIKRTLQERLDDRVSVRSFGVKGDGVTDDTVALQRAIDQLYLNSAVKGSAGSRVVLHIEAGVYNISNTLYIPPYASIVGAGKDKTVFDMSVNKPVFITVNGTSTPANPANDSSSDSDNQAQNILVKGLTINTTGAGVAGDNDISSEEQADSAKGIILQSCKNSVFENIKLTGVWTTGDIDDQNNAVVINQLSGAVESDNNQFIGCEFYGFGTAVKSKWDIEHNLFDKCVFGKTEMPLGYAFMFGKDAQLGNAASGMSTGPVNNVISRSVFDSIHRQVIWVVNGIRNTSKQNRYISCANNGQTDVLPVYPVIKFEKDSNKSFEDFFSRTAALSYGNSLNNVPYIPEVEGTAMYALNYENTVGFGQSTNVRLFRLPGVVNQAYEIDYTMVSENYSVSRSGTMHVVVNSYNETVQISDEFHYVGDETYLDRISFDSSLSDANNDQDAETINIKVTSSMPTDDQTQFKYTITAKKTDIG